jgi:hypothetical protein
MFLKKKKGKKNQYVNCEITSEVYCHLAKKKNY